MTYFSGKDRFVDIRRKDFITVIPVILFVLTMTVYNLCRTPNQYSESERRALARRPAVTGESLKEGTFMTQFDEAAADQFPLRDYFRAVKFRFGSRILLQKDQHGLYIVDDYISKLDYPVREQRVAEMTASLNEVYDRYLAGTNCRLFWSAIPDKSYFLAGANHYPSMDYGQLVEQVNLEFAQNPAHAKEVRYLPVMDKLVLEDYYMTDPHWKQEKITDIAEWLCGEMSRQGEQTEREKYTEHTLTTSFRGAYAGQLAISDRADTIVCLTNEVTDSAIVTNYDTGVAKPAKIYNEQKAAGRDAYECFLEGSTALITIDNPLCEDGGELILFRDSFGSSIAPLMLADYSRITLVDLRYIRSSMLGDFITFDDQDVLFLYSTLILNH